MNRSSQNDVLQASQQLQADHQESAAIDLEQTIKEMAEQLGLNNCRPFHPFTKPTARLSTVLSSIYGLLQEGEHPKGAAPPTGPTPASSPKGAVSSWGGARRKPNAAAEFDLLGRLVAELASCNGLWISYSRKSEWYTGRSKYGLLPPSCTRKRMVRLVDRLRTSGLVDHIKGYRLTGVGYQSLLRPSGKFWGVLMQLGSIAPSDKQTLSQADPEAPLVVIHNEEGAACAPNDPNLYEAACWKVKTLREWMRTFEVTSPVCVGSNELTQHFNSAEMDKGGRYYGWWQNLTKEDRLRISLNGDSVAELDFQMNHPSILYHSLRLHPPENTYIVPGLPKSMPPEKQRELVKHTFGRMLNSRSESGTRSKLGLELRNRTLANHIIDTLLVTHSRLAEKGKFWTGIGHQLMHDDSKVATEVMRWAQFASVPLLPVHDSFIVRRSDANECRKMMKQAYHAYFGIKPEIKGTILNGQAIETLLDVRTPVHLELTCLD